MPANIIMADTGDIRKVVGRRIDIAPNGPIPGSTPTSVPIKTPIKQAKRFTGCNPTEKP